MGSVCRYLLVGLAALGVRAAPAPLALAPAGAALRAAATQPLALEPAAGTWDLSAYDSVYLRLRNPGETAVTVWARADNAGAAGIQDSCRTAMQIEPGATARLRLRLMRRPEDPGYEPFRPFFMYSRGINVRDGTIDPAAVARVVVWLEPAVAGQVAVLEAATAEGAGVAAPVPFFPWVDRYGQYRHTDWPGKIQADADFAERLREERDEMRAYPGPANWDQYGGWADGPRLEATGFFRAEKVEGKWWLVDPDGRLFWSYGPTGVGSGGEGSPVTGKERWFADLPVADGPLGRYWSEGRGARYMFYQDGGPWRAFSFGSANAERKYGADWRAATSDLLHGRLRNWGFNTIANWSDAAVYLQRRTPYVVAIHYGGPWLEHIPDVFAPEFEQVLRERLEAERATTAGDRWNIGYFVDNELAWSYLDGAEGAIRGALRAEPRSATKRELLARLQAKYGAIEGLNNAWGSGYQSWDAMAAARELPDVGHAEARGADLAAFGLEFAERYFRTVRDAVKAVAPQNLYLGCRFHGHIDPAVVAIAAKYADVVSYNVYEEPGGRLNRYVEPIDRPFLVGEFGIGSDPLQTPFRGERPSVDPAERVRALEEWVHRAIVHPLVVGGHYFQFRDQPITGRPDGEAVLRGFVNTADTPHFELVQANRRLGYQLYHMRSTGRIPSIWSGQPLRGPIGVGTWQTQAEFRDIRVERDGNLLYAQGPDAGLAGWRTIGGEWEAEAGVLRQRSGDENVRAVCGEPAWGDYTLSLRARKLGGREGFLILFGVPDDTTKCWWNLGGWGNTQHGLEVPGAPANRVGGSIETGRWYEIRVELRGPAVRCWLDGVLVQEAER